MRRKQLALEAIAIAEEKSDQTMKSQTGAELLDQSMTSECAVIQGHSSEEEEKESLWNRAKKPQLL